MRLLYVTNGLETGGIETNIVRLTRALSARGHDVVCASRPGVLVEAFKAAGGRHLPLQMKLRNPRALLADRTSLAGMIRDQRPDLIHVFSATGGALVRLCGARNTPIVSSIMGLRNHPDEPAYRSHVRNWMTMLGAQRVLLIAPAIDRMARRLPVRPERFARQHVVGVETWNGGRPTNDTPEAVRASLGLPPGAPLVLTIGRLDPTKSHDLFVRAAAKVAQTHPHAKFAIVGEGALRRTLERLVADLGLTDRLTLFGERHDVSRLLSAATVCVRPGIVEGFVGITVLEAQALAVPVVAFETEDVRLAVRHEETGLLVRPGDSAELGQAIARLLDDPRMAHRIGAAGRTHLESTFAISAVAEALEARYILETGGTPSLDLDKVAWSTD